MVHVAAEVKMHLIKLFLHFELHHADAGARVSASTANDLKNVLVGFPIRLDLIVTELFLNLIKVINGELDALVDLLSVQVHHDVFVLLPVQMLKYFLLCLFFLKLVLFLQLFQLGNLGFNLLFRALSTSIK